MTEMNTHARAQVLACLKELGDADFQKRIWLHGEGPDVSSFDELISQLFDDTALTEYLEGDLPEPIFSEEVDAALKSLSQLLDGIPRHLSVRELLEDPRWHRVRELATHAANLVEHTKAP